MVWLYGVAVRRFTYAIEYHRFKLGHARDCILLPIPGNGLLLVFNHRKCSGSDLGEVPGLDANNRTKCPIIQRFLAKLSLTFEGQPTAH